MSTFDKAFELLIGHEGGYVNDPRDPGGETKFGISKRAHPLCDIAGLTVGDAKAIYKKDYWDKVKGDSLPPMVAFAVFDAAVNNGVHRASQWLQEAVKVPADGAIGNQTLAGVRKRFPEDVLVDFCAARLRFMVHLATWNDFSGGWSRRLVKIPYEAAKHFA
jgi:lysozyme family protein